MFQYVHIIYLCNSYIYGGMYVRGPHFPSADDQLYFNPENIAQRSVLSLMNSEIYYYYYYY